MSRWHECSQEDCDQLAYDYDECDDCREARRQDRRKMPKREDGQWRD